MENAIQNRDIKYLLHFTCTDNLASILQFGLLPKNMFGELPNRPNINDRYRLDGHNECLSVSISFPNYKMFYSIRKSLENEQKEWVVIVISPQVLLTKDCLYCIENAASSNMTCIPDENKRGKEAFNKLFDEYPGKPSRQVLGIPNNYPTHPQAEILIPGGINPSYFLGVAFNSPQILQKYSNLTYGSFKFKSIPSFFSYRSDHASWSTATYCEELDAPF